MAKITGMQGGRAGIVAAVIVLLLSAGAALAGFLLHPAQPATLAGSSECAACHQQAFELWQSSHHRHAMLPASPGSVLGDFNEAKFEYAGITSRFFRRGDDWFVETDNARGEMETFRIAYTFGWHPLQQYLVEFPDGRLQALTISWDARSREQGGQRWFHLHEGDDVTHEDALHWTGAFQNWNSRCASCHSTGLSKGYDAAADRHDTRWSEVNVGCEACHGPASRHLAWARGARWLRGKGLARDLSAHWQANVDRHPDPAQVPGMGVQLQVCSGCHARRTELQAPDVTAPFFDNFMLSPLLAGMYHPDGQILDEVFETGSFLQSRMHQNRVTCTNCHEPHSGRLRARGNALCTQCHEAARFDNVAHTFHAAGQPGGQCVDCHMPSRTYMGVDVRHDHSFRIPDPLAGQRFGVPDACTQCHADRDAAWAAGILAQRTGRTQPRYAHAALLHGVRRGDASVMPDLLAFAREPANPAVLRAIALTESARFPSQQQVDVVAGSLVDADPMVRSAAAASLDFLDAPRRFAALSALLEDPVKSVRLAAARHLADVKPDQAPPGGRQRLSAAFDEYRAALLHNADMPESMNELGLFLAAQGDVAGAEAAFTKARQLAPRYLPAMLNLADAWRARGRDDLGEPLLREALAHYPESGEVHQAMGLLQVRAGRVSGSVEYFRRASALSPDNPRYVLVHAASLAESGRRAEAIRILDSAVRRFPADTALREALEGYRAGAGPAAAPRGETP